MTLVEVMVALVVLTFSVFMVTSTITTSTDQSTAKLERAIAADAAMNKLEEMRAQPFSQLFRLYNATPEDDPGGPGTAPGPHFAVPGLTPAADDEDGFAGRVTLPSPGPELRESMVHEALGMPRDLNGDCLIDDADRSSSYIVLPVQVTIEWKGKQNKQSITMFTLFSKLEKQ